ncbi:MAG: hypothetical protein QHH00_04765 [Methanomassiliicoccales archaeon]|jgi:hypothetical protein|nr:hypothetical protein [Methanomassiliicoccales archaeon]
MIQNEIIKMRKRLTRAGSGGFSIYLPKKWVRGWSRDQVKDREVEMFNIENYLILAPKGSKKKIEISVEHIDSEDLKEYIVSSFINGADEFRLQSSLLTDALIGESRSIIRMLDENLEPTSNNNVVSYINRSSIAHETPSLIALLFDKLSDGENLILELIQSFDSNPEKGIHLLRLLYMLEEEDIDRIAFQIMRNVSKLDVSSHSITELNLVWAMADALERIGDTLYSITGLICDFYGLEREELRYPVEYLQQHIVSKNFTLPECVRHLKDDISSDMRNCYSFLLRIKKSILERNGRDALRCAHDIACYMKRTERDYWDKIAKIARPLAIREYSSFLLCNSLALSMWNLLLLTEGLAKRLALVYYVDQKTRSAEIYNDQE